MALNNVSVKRDTVVGQQTWDQKTADLIPCHVCLSKHFLECQTGFHRGPHSGPQKVSYNKSTFLVLLLLFWILNFPSFQKGFSTGGVFQFNFMTCRWEIPTSQYKLAVAKVAGFFWTPHVHVVIGCHFVGKIIKIYYGRFSLWSILA